jgi:hypothetical protein|nr:MAG TPA: hypothetical protein [Caudoviricetes sp.]
MDIFIGQVSIGPRLSGGLPERAAQFTCYNQTVIEMERIQKLSALYDFIFAIII